MTHKYPSSYSEAVEQTSSLYYTNKPCRRGHLSVRRTCNKECVACEQDRNKDQYDRNREKYMARAVTYNRNNPVNTMLARVKNRAKTDGIPFDLDISDIIVPETCPVLGIPLVWSRDRLSDNSPSLDKRVPSLGYVKGNVYVISNRANRIKNDGTIKEHQLIIEYMERTSIS